MSARLKDHFLRDEAAITANVRFANPGGCFVWLGKRNGRGYGTVGRWDENKRASRSHVVHRYVYERFVGPIPDGLVLDHLCGNKLCVNVMHLEPVTQGENVRRAKGKRWDGHVPATTCKHGHPKHETPSGWKCRACGNAASKKHYHNRKFN